MEIFFQLLPYLVISGMLLLMILTSLAVWGGAMAVPRYFLYLYLSVLLVFSSGTTWGVIEPETVFNIYSRGTGRFYFSFVSMFLYGMSLAMVFSLGFSNKKNEPINVTLFFWLFAFLVAIHVMVGTFYDVHPLWAMSTRGVFNVINMGLIFFVFLSAFRNEVELRQLGKLLFIVVLAKQLYGIFRFLFLGGDPANVYRNTEDLPINIVFFDINDSLISTMMAFYVAWRLVHDWNEMDGRTRFLFVFALFVSLFVVVFSFRRTAWAGLLVALVLFLVYQPWRRRIQASLIAALTIGPILAWTVYQRMQVLSYGSFWERLFPDVYKGGGFQYQEGRFIELYKAWLSLKEDWLWGLGTWGRFRGEGTPELSFHFGAYDFVHSGFGHILLKTGAIGLFLFGGIFFMFVRYVFRTRQKIEPRNRALFEAAFAGFLFSLPTLMFGTPITEYRTMQLLGIVIAMPYLIYRVQQAQTGFKHSSS